MARICASVKSADYSSSVKGGGGEDEEEALSLCDLPLTLVKEESPQLTGAPDEEPEPDLDFEFSLLGAPSSLSSSESNLCAADDVFFRGKILPLRRAPSADGGRVSSLSDSAEHGSSSSGGGSTRSRHNSSDARARNPFHSHPSPKPQIRIPAGRAQIGRRSTATLWDMIRVGPMRAPEIELRDLKLRSNNSSRSSSTNSSSSKNSNDNKAVISGGVSDDYRRNSFDYGLLSGCKCSISDVEIPSSRRSKKISDKVISIKNRGKATEGGGGGERGKQKESMTRHRTFEWVKELSRGVGPPPPFDDVP